jgi:branched-chain amino acid aminotransferase
MLDAGGFLAETNATHLFFAIDGVLCTPTTRACPEGITRATVLRLAADAGIPTDVGDFGLPRLYSAAEAFVTGTMGELTPVLAVDGRSIGDGNPGPLTKRLAAAYAELTASSGTPVT